MGMDETVSDIIAKYIPNNIDLIVLTLYLEAYAIVTEIIKLRHKII